MITIDAEPGENPFDLFERALEHLKSSNYSTCYVQHNEIKIMVYYDSTIADLCDKFELQRRIIQLNNKT